MKRAVLLLLMGAVLGVGGMSLAQVHEDGERVKVLSVHDVEEELDGKDAAVTVVEVTIESRQSGPPHRHPGSAIGYVLEGEYELGIDDQPTKRFKPARRSTSPPDVCTGSQKTQPRRDARAS